MNFASFLPIPVEWYILIEPVLGYGPNNNAYKRYPIASLTHNIQTIYVSSGYSERLILPLLGSLL